MNSWQDIAALLLVCLALASLLRRGWRLFFKPVSGCGACGGCPSAGRSTTPSVTTLSVLPPGRKNG